VDVGPADGAEGHPSGSALTISAEAQLEFARSYLSEERYADAVRELERFIHFFPDDPRVPDARYAVGWAHLQAGEPERAAKVLETVAGEIGTGLLSPSDTAVRAHFTLAAAYVRMDEPGRAVAVLQNLVAVTENREIRDAAFYRMGWTYLEAEAWRPARLAFGNIHPENHETFRLPELAEEMAAMPEVPQKSPVVAGSLATVPGAGYLYLGRNQDALIAFLLNGALGLAAWEAFDNGNEALGGLLSVVGVGFYTGSIYGSISAAHKFNQDQTRDFLDRVKDQVGVGLSRGPDGEARLGFGISGTF
jgi:tetratricopeptide (TPR) repeat protein